MHRNDRHVEGGPKWQVQDIGAPAHDGVPGARVGIASGNVEHALTGIDADDTFTTEWPQGQWRRDATAHIELWPEHQRHQCTTGPQ